MIILIDECVSSKFAKWLRNQGLEDILCISECPRIRGVDDDTLLSFCESTSAYLITQDSIFYERYEGPKTYYKNRQWKKTLKEIKQYNILNS